MSRPRVHLVRTRVSKDGIEAWRIIVRCKIGDSEIHDRRTIFRHIDAPMAEFYSRTRRAVRSILDDHKLDFAMAEFAEPLQ